MQTAWENEPRSYIQCVECASKQKRKRVDYEFFTCQTCQREWPEVAFINNPKVANKYGRDALVTLQSAGKLHLVTCAACVLADTDVANTMKQCTKCQRKMPLHGPSNDDCDGWSPTKIREYLEHSTTWICYNCQHPKCTNCGARPILPDRGGIMKGPRLCTACRPVEPAQERGTSTTELKECNRCNMKKNKFDSFDRYQSGNWKPFCRSCDREQCLKCQVEKHRDEFRKNGRICNDCREEEKREPWLVSRHYFSTDTFKQH